MVTFTAYHSTAKAFVETLLDKISDQLGTEGIKTLNEKVLVGLGKIGEVHKCKEEDRAGCEIEVPIDNE